MFFSSRGLFIFFLNPTLRTSTKTSHPNPQGRLDQIPHDNRHCCADLDSPYKTSHPAKTNETPKMIILSIFFSHHRPTPNFFVCKAQTQSHHTGMLGITFRPSGREQQKLEPAQGLEASCFSANRTPALIFGGFESIVFIDFSGGWCHFDSMGGSKVTDSTASSPLGPR